MNTLYIICNQYLPTGASTNRILALIKGLSQYNLKIKVLFIVFDKDCSKITDSYPNTEFVYLWDGGGKNRLFVFIRSYLKILKYICHCDNVLITSPKLMRLPLYLFNSNIFHERTEHPDVVRNTKSRVSNFWNMCYLDNCRKIKGLFVITENLKKYFVANGVEENKISIINIVADDNKYNNIKKSEISENYFVYSGTISLVKDGTKNLLLAFSQVVKIFSDTKLYITGHFLNQSDEKLIRQCVFELGINENVSFLGRIPFNCLLELQVNAKALLLPRPDNLQNQCNFPTKLGEYLLTENPVIITPVGSVGKYFEDGKNALIADHDDVDSFASKMLWVLENPAKAKVIGENGKKIALDNFNYKVESKKIIDLIFNN